jgi:hypothetical protein
MVLAAHPQGAAAAPGEGKGWVPMSPPLARSSMAPLHWQSGWWSSFA